MKNDAYDRIAPLYDLLDAPYEFTWRGRLRARMFEGLSGRILDAGVGTGRNIPHYPIYAEVIGIDASAGMLEQARRRAHRLDSRVELRLADIMHTGFPDASLDAIVSTFVFCVLDEVQQLPALRELRRICKPGGTIRLLDYTLSTRPLTKLIMRTLEQMSRPLFAARYDVRTEAYVEPAGLTTVDRRFVFSDMVRLLELRPTEPGEVRPSAARPRWSRARRGRSRTATRPRRARRAGEDRGGGWTMGIAAPTQVIADTAALSAALAICAAESAAALPVLSEADRMRLVAAAEGLSWRRARSVVGEGERQVLQDFALAPRFPESGPYRETAALIDAAIAAAARRLRPNPLPEGFHINDLILQRYAPGSRGITPHRDHLRYRGLVGLIVVSGDGRFCLCDDRSGVGEREIAAEPGDLLLMRAPGFAGSPERPFHFLDRITIERLSFGLRWDTTPGRGD